MSRKNIAKTVVVLLVVLGALSTALAQMPNAYGRPLAWKMRRRRRNRRWGGGENKWTVAVAIVGRRGRSFTTRKWTTRSSQRGMAIDKARTAALFKRRRRRSGCIGGWRDGLAVLT